MATSSAITSTKKEEGDEPKPAEETLMMASTSDMNSAIKLTVGSSKEWSKTKQD